METRTSGTFRAALLGAFLVAAPAAHANMYKWTTEDGSVTYSNTPPRDRSKVKDFTKIDDINTVPLDNRPKESQAAARRPGALAPDTAFRPETILRADPPAAKADAAGDGATREAEAPKPDGAPRTATHSLQPQAVQDPCLRSSDPQCHEKNKDKYHPYMGYAPGMAKPAVGATSAAGAGGAVGAQVSIVPNAAAAEKRQAATTQVAPPINVKTK